MLCLTTIVLLFACHEKKKATAQLTDEFLPGKKLAELDDKKLDEVSGLACSINNPGLMWTVADSGNDAEVFLIDDHTKIRQVFALEGIKNRDWEEVAVGPGPDETKHYVYVADIGDNYVAHRYKRIYRFEEPTFNPGDKKIKIANFDTITFELEGSRKDTEAILIDPGTKDMYIVSKRESPVSLYQLKYPYSTLDTLIATEIASLPFTYIVAASSSQDGTEILMKSYNHIYYWKNPSAKPFSEMLKEKPLEVPYEAEPQGESIAWTNDGNGFYTLSEKTKGKKSFLYFYSRKK